MITVKIHQPIASADENMLFTLGRKEQVFSLKTVQRLFEDNAEETDFTFNIHCDGGEVSEGLAIYDYLRSSGRNIYMNIEGKCHSMAVTLLLAAPYENRTAAPNAMALIHKVRNSVAGDIDFIEAATEDMRRLQSAILDIYADRTHISREKLEEIMRAEKAHTATELLNWGFISKIKPYNTNITMTTILSKITNFIDSMKKEVEGAVNYVFYGDEGKEMFRTDREDDFLEVGMPAYPYDEESGEFDGEAGEFDLGERIVVIREKEIVEIREKEDERDAELRELRAENEKLRNALEETQAKEQSATSQLEEARNLLIEAKKHITSTGKIGGRVGAPETIKNKASMSGAERKAAIKAKLQKN